MQLKSYIPQATKARFGAHVMPWFDNLGGNGHMKPGYASDDSGVISRQGGLMQAVGISWINIDYNPGEEPSVSATKKWEAECRNRNMFITVMMDGKSKASTTAMIQALTDLAWLFDSPAYKRWGGIAGQCQVSDFDAKGIDWTAVQAKFPNLTFLHLHSGFSWISAGVGTNPNAVADLAAQNKRLGANGWQSVWAGFHDNNWQPPTVSAERFVDYRNGQTFLDTCATITPDCADAFVVWNDYDERSGIERNLDEALNNPPQICKWPPPIGGKYLWPLPLGNVFGLAPVPNPIPAPPPAPAPVPVVPAPTPIPLPSTVGSVSMIQPPIIISPVRIDGIVTVTKQLVRTEVWVDGNKMFQGRDPHIVTSLNLAKGNHEITVQGIDLVDGQEKIIKKVFNLTVE